MSDANESDGDPIARDKLRSFVERIERLNEERDGLSEDLSEVYAEARANGFDVAAMKAVIVIRRKDQAARREFESIVELYMSALGMSEGTES